MHHWNKDNCRSSTHQFQKHNFLFSIGYRNNKNTGPNHSFLWENPWQNASRQEHTERFLLQLFFFNFYFSLNKRITEDGDVGFFSPAPMKFRESDRQQPARMPYAMLPSGLQASAHTKCLCLEVVLMEPSSSLSPKENKDLQERGQTGNKLANSAASGCIQHRTKASRKQGSGHKHSSHLLLWRNPPVSQSSSVKRRKSREQATELTHGGVGGEPNKTMC